MRQGAGADEVGRSEQRIFLRRFDREHIQRRARDLAAFKAIFQSRFVNQPAARAVDDADTLLCPFEPFAAEDVAGFISQRGVQRDEIGARQQRVEIDLLHAHFHRAILRQEGIIGDYLHLEAKRAAGDN